MSRATLPLLLALALALAAPAAAARPGKKAKPEPPKPPPVPAILKDVPDLKDMTPAASERAWYGVKDIGNPASQLRAIARQGLYHTECTGLVDMRALVDGGVDGFSFRDNVRGRSWARPSLALVLVEAMKRFRKDYPKHTLAIGDITQPGCGQVEHGTLVKDLTGPAADAFLKGARLVRSAPTDAEVVTAAAFPYEDFRFTAPTDPVYVEQRVVGKRVAKDGAISLRVATRRYVKLAAPTDAEVKDLLSGLARLARRTKAAAIDRTESDAGDGKTAPVAVLHWVDTKAKEQLVVYATTVPKRAPDPDDLLEVRVSTWLQKNPGSFKGEVRWVKLADGRWERWQLMYEAGHVSHHTGRDADLSYLTTDNDRQFAVDLDAMDVPATWRWLQVLEATAKDLGDPVEMIFVDAKIKRHLQEHLPRSVRKTSTWRLLHILAGHDGHHHVRLEPVSDRAEAQAARKLEKLVATTDGAR
ncbi:MAG: penicillin-insensitive murein endopeptidase [Myxococcales bacterium]|nr:penicillin-insensitive murein endopeptidase [Myxococcales bacterium]MCB9736469.1 penicillin-insensitive murein endopeptidase [Deltaproteobacteria bacterium]